MEVALLVMSGVLIGLAAGWWFESRKLRGQLTLMERSTDRFARSVGDSHVSSISQHVQRIAVLSDKVAELSERAARAETALMHKRKSEEKIDLGSMPPVGYVLNSDEITQTNMYEGARP